MLKMKFNFPLKTIMVLTVLTLPSGAAAFCTGNSNIPSDQCGATLSASELGIAADPSGVTRLPSRRPLGERMERLTTDQRLAIVQYLEEQSVYYAKRPYGRLEENAHYREAWTQLQSIIYQVENAHTGAQGAYSIVGVQENGIETTINCSEPCTFGSVTKHAMLSGLQTMVPRPLLESVREAQSYGRAAFDGTEEDDGGDGAWVEAAALMQTSGVLSTDTNANAAARIHPFTIILAIASRSANLQNQQDDKEPYIRPVNGDADSADPTTAAADTTTAAADTTTAAADTTTKDTETTAVLPPNCTREYNGMGGYDINC